MLTRSEERAFRAFDRQEAREPVEHEPWEPIQSPRATAAQIQQFIEDLALTGKIEDNLGNYVTTAPIYQALACDWVDDKMKLPATTYLAFERWAIAMCNEMLRAAV